MGTVSAFVGESRKLLVNDLYEEYKRIVATRGTLLVSLEAPSGWGKTRIIHEFYASLAADQPQPRYWPDSIDDHKQGRKAVRPGEFERPANSLLNYFWWGIARSNIKGQATNSLRDDIKQIDDHRIFLEEAQKRLSTNSMALRAKEASSSFVREAAKEGAGQITGKVLAETAGQAVPLLNITLRLARLGIKTAKKRHEESKIIRESAILGTDQEAVDVVEGCIELISHMCASNIPVVVFLEDIHLADEMLLELVSGLLLLEGPILIFTSTLPEMIENEPGLSKLFTKHKAKIERVQHDIELGSPFSEGAGLAALNHDDCEALVRGHFPKHNKDAMQALLKKYNNPYHIELACEVLRKHCPTGELALEPHTITHILPQGLKDLLTAVWGSLPTELRLGLAIAHVITPSAIDSYYNPPGRRSTDGSFVPNDTRWTVRTLHDVMSSLDLPRKKQILEEFSKAPTAYAWIKELDDHLRAFAELDHSNVVDNDVKSLLDSELLAHGRELALKALASVLASYENEDRQSNNLARTVLVLHAEEFIADKEIAARAIDTLLRDLQDAPRELSERLQLYEKFIDLESMDLEGLEIPEEVSFSIHHSGGYALQESGKLAEAVATFESLLMKQTQSLGVGDSYTLGTRISLMRSLTKSHRYEEAMSHAEELSEWLRESLEFQQDFARLLSYAGRADEAMALFKSILSRLETAEFADEVLALSIREDMAVCLGHQGRAAEAVQVYEEILAERKEKEFPNSHGILHTRNQLGIQLNDAGRSLEAKEVYEDLLSDRKELQGPNHPETLYTTRCYSECLRDLGLFDDAIGQLKKLLQVQGSVMDYNNPEIFETQRELASCLYEIGGIDEAVALLEDIIHKQTLQFGHDHDDTLNSRDQLGSLLHGAGRTEAALTVYQAVVDDSARLMGYEHRETLVTRSKLAKLLFEMGKVDSGRTELSVVVEDSVRTLGTDHPDTLLYQDLLDSFE